MAIFHYVQIMFSVLVIFPCFTTLFQFGLFLSLHSALKQQQLTLLENSDEFDNIWSSLFVDGLLLLVFMMQHSLQNKKLVKECLAKLGLGSIERLLYNLGSSISLQILMAYWQSIPNWTMWKLSTDNNIYLWFLFTSIHSISWLIIYGGCFIMDITDLLGVKQVYHNCQGWPEPLQLKSEGLQRFYSHMRHPCFSTLAIILIIHPVMQFDRLVLAIFFIIYMSIFLKVDDVDYAYQRRMLQRKERDLHIE